MKSPCGRKHHPACNECFAQFRNDCKSLLHCAREGKARMESSDKIEHSLTVTTTIRSVL